MISFLLLHTIRQGRLICRGRCNKNVPLSKCYSTFTTTAEAIILSTVIELLGVLVC